MKKFCILFLGLFIIILTAITTGTQTTSCNTDYLRVHIRANSNLVQDQSVKYFVRDAVVDAVTPWIANCQNKQQALTVIQGHVGELQDISQAVLTEHGFFYGATVSVKEEAFPTRIYEEYTLEAGVYDALIIELGAGVGDNWWCCIYPPLCFTQASGNNVIYRSKILEMIEEFFKNN